MVLKERLYTIEEFWEIATLPENADKRLELDEGVIVEMGSSSKRNTVTAARMIYFLSALVVPNNLGVVTSPDAGFKLGSKSYRQPDVAFVSKAAVADLNGTYFTVAPDLAVEIVSEDEDVLKKANEYIRAGTRIVWALYPDEKQVFVCKPKTDTELSVQVLSIDDTLDGGAVLPGFSLPVRDIFPD